MGIKIQITHSSDPVSFQSMDALWDQYNLDYKELLSIHRLSKAWQITATADPRIKAFLWQLRPRQVMWLAQVAQLVSSIIRAGTGFLMHALSTAGELSFFHFCFLENGAKLK